MTGNEHDADRATLGAVRLLPVAASTFNERWLVELRDGARVAVSAAPSSMAPANGARAPGAPTPNEGNPATGSPARPGSGGR